MLNIYKKQIVVLLDSCIWLPPDLPKDFAIELRHKFVHTNPTYYANQRMGFSNYNTDRQVKTWRYQEDCLGKHLTIPRGGVGHLRRLCQEYNIELKWIDRRTSCPVTYPGFVVHPEHPDWELRDYQVGAVEAALQRQQGVIRAPTGCLSGKTTFVEVRRAGDVFPIRLSDLYNQFVNGVLTKDFHYVGYRMYQTVPVDIEIKALAPDGSLQFFKINNVFDSGLKQFFRLVLHSGRTIDCTYDHKIMTSIGWVQLQQLLRDMSVVVDDGNPLAQHDRVVTIQHGIDPVRMYDIEVDEVSNFVANGIVVHNSGKTTAALNLIYRAKERALVVMRDKNLLKQWCANAKASLGLKSNQIGYIMGGRKYHPGKSLTLALQQTLNSKIDVYKQIFRNDPFGITIIDECHTLASKTYIKVVGEILSKYLIGFSADETRRDKKEFLIYDHMGDIIHETKREYLEDSQVIHPVTIRVVESDFRADWYAQSPPEERNFTSLVEEMVTDIARNELIVSVIQHMRIHDETPALVFTARREHAHDLVAYFLAPNNIKSGILLGGDGEDSRRFALDKAALLSNNLDVGIGTFQAIGTGHDIPVLRAGLCSTPISHNNPQFFAQVRGRFCRLSKSSGKTEAILYYIWDKYVFPNYLQFLEKHNPERVQVFRNGRWCFLRELNWK